MITVNQTRINQLRKLAKDVYQLKLATPNEAQEADLARAHHHLTEAVAELETAKKRGKLTCD